MPSLDNPGPTDREAYRLGSLKIALVEALVLLALSGAFIFYVNWSSEAAWADFMGASKPSVTESIPHAQSSVPVQTAKGAKACRFKQTGWRAAYSETV
jgi:hypothetical protein